MDADGRDNDGSGGRVVVDLTTSPNKQQEQAVTCVYEAPLNGLDVLAISPSKFDDDPLELALESSLQGRAKNGELIDELQLSAKLGQLLLQQNEELRSRLVTVEKANVELTDILETNLDEVKLLERRCSTMQRVLRQMERASLQRDTMLDDKEHEVEVLQVQMQKVTSEREFYWKQYLTVKHRLQELEEDFYEYKVMSTATSRYTHSSDEDSDNRGGVAGSQLHRMATKARTDKARLRQWRQAVDTATDTDSDNDSAAHTPTSRQRSNNRRSRLSLSSRQDEDGAGSGGGGGAGNGVETTSRTDDDNGESCLLYTSPSPRDRG